MSAPVVLQLPVLSSNKYWRPVPIGGHITIVPTKEAKEYKKTVQAIAKAAGITAPIEGRVKIEYMLYPHRPLDWKKRMRDFGDDWDDTVQCIDLDNALKVMLDAIKGVVIVDDKWVRRIFGYLMEPDEHGERLVVRVTKIERGLRQGDLI
jgi:crossover junction endodeoxyribonuclease RusA